MSNTSATSRQHQHDIPLCPVGEAQCLIIDEVASLREQVVTDPLTGLYNLRYFHAALEQELERTERTRVATALMMVDLDHFKRINDNWGHETGNDVLRQTALIIRDSTRKLDVQCRYGGEEFVIILPSTERRLALMVAERLRQNIAAACYQADGQPIVVTASIGVALHSIETPCDAAGLMAAADKYLYQAKNGGRNQVCYAPLEEEAGMVSVEEKSLLGSMFSDGADDDDFSAADDSWPES